ncbi:pyrimidine reductase family protein [Rugosimonospora acidiphila]|uniref:Pyrimidine reductase family protein n=1 Tax=Rugosimonospora acidiphila TaxID=556531 RepID=A0ABP9RNF9_9ACTN
MHRIWPATDPTPLDDAALIALYQPTTAVLRVNFVTSVDGAVEVEGHSKGLQSPGDQQVFPLLRMFAEGLMVGAGTIREEGYGGVRPRSERRDWRVAHGLDPYPRLIIVSRRLDLSPTHPAFADAATRPIVITCAGSPADRRAALAEVADVLEHGEHEVDLAAAVTDLRARGLDQILCEGGPHLFGSLTEGGLVDEVCLTMTPMLAGPGAGRITAGVGTGVQGLTLAHALYDDGTLLLRYARNA